MVLMGVGVGVGVGAGDGEPESATLYDHTPVDPPDFPDRSSDADGSPLLSGIRTVLFESVGSAKPTSKTEFVVEPALVRSTYRNSIVARRTPR